MGFSQHMRNLNIISDTLSVQQDSTFNELQIGLVDIDSANQDHISHSLDDIYTLINNDNSLQLLLIGAVIGAVFGLLLSLLYNWIRIQQGLLKVFRSLFGSEQI